MKEQNQKVSCCIETNESHYREKIKHLGRWYRKELYAFRSSLFSLGEPERSHIHINGKKVVCILTHTTFQLVFI